MKPANDNRRANYKRPKAKFSAPLNYPRDIFAWEIDSSLRPDSAAGQQIVGRG